MDIYNALALFFAMIILAASPGPGLFAVVSRSLASGFSHASVVTMGLILGDIIYLLLAIYGLSEIATLMGELFIVIKYLGGAYLLYLGYKIWTAEVKEEKIHGIKESSWFANFLSGLLITLGNPKVIVFYLGFLPAFMNLQTLNNKDIFIAVFIVASTLGAVILSYAYLAARSRKFFKSKSSMEKLNKTSGVVMISAGSLLILNN
ncbi:MAG: LysE family translocator [Campylobacterota bacterium]|nr:LysE family translocator [Campylobacterota bacterium]